MTIIERPSLGNETLLLDSETGALLGSVRFLGFNRWGWKAKARDYVFATRKEAIAARKAEILKRLGGPLIG